MPTDQQTGTDPIIDKIIELLTYALPLFRDDQKEFAAAYPKQPPAMGEPHEKVFEEFFRVRPNDGSVANGNGLGLAISRRIARLLGGDVTVSDGDGGGAVFTLWFTSSSATRERGRNARGRAALPAAQVTAKVI